jgi:hypothetical protein
MNQEARRFDPRLILPAITTVDMMMTEEVL